MQTRDRFAAVVRREGGLSAVAAALGISVSMASMLATGKRVPGRDLAAAIERRWAIRASDWPSAAL